MTTSNPHFTDKAAQYADEKKVYQLFEKLLNDLVIKQPRDPIQFMINELQAPEVDRVMMIGPPCSGKKTLASMLSEKYGLVSLDINSMSELDGADEVSQALKSRVQECTNTGQPMDSALAADLLAHRAAQSDCIQQGWVLVGFPRNREDALNLQMKGMFPDKLFSLEVEAKILESRGCFHHDESKASYAEFNKNIKSITSTMQKDVCRVNANAGLDEVANQIDELFNFRAKNSAPHRAMRIVIQGPPGSGKTTQAAKLSHRYRSIHLNLDDLIKQAVREDKAIGHELRLATKRGGQAPDDKVVELVCARLSQPDVKKQGFILDGIPQNAEQARMLREAGFHISHYIHLDISSDYLEERISGRRFDPVTGATYHVRTNIPEDPIVQHRMKQIESDTPEVLSSSIQTYSTNAGPLLDFYNDVRKDVDASRSAVNVNESLQYYLDRMRKN
eukprot:GFYU01005280.1.p1 GENE.GFYU01005280.1~~GFYU01005280.1.p1  ORF type:complete len:447 (+),score=47.77 GFYU01005280.1:22-1362(+)